MELLLAIIIFWGGTGYLVSQDAEKRNETKWSTDRQVRLIQETREIQYKREVIKEWGNL